MSQVLTPPKTDMYEQAALAWAQEMGYEGAGLPAGDRRRSFGCPLARATGLQVGMSVAFSEEQRYSLPERVRCFRTFFDAGHYPHLDIDRQGE